MDDLEDEQEEHCTASKYVLSRIGLEENKMKNYERYNIEKHEMEENKHINIDKWQKTSMDKPIKNEEKKTQKMDDLESGQEKDWIYVLSPIGLEENEIKNCERYNIEREEVVENMHINIDNWQKPAADKPIKNEEKKSFTQKTGDFEAGQEHCMKSKYGLSRIGLEENDIKNCERYNIVSEENRHINIDKWQKPADSKTKVEIKASQPIDDKLCNSSNSPFKGKQKVLNRFKNLSKSHNKLPFKFRMSNSEKVENRHNEQSKEKEAPSSAQNIDSSEEKLNVQDVALDAPASMDKNSGSVVEIISDGATNYPKSSTDAISASFHSKTDPLRKNKQKKQVNRKSNALKEDLEKCFFMKNEFKKEKQDLSQHIDNLLTKLESFEDTLEKYKNLTLQNESRSVTYNESANDCQSPLESVCNPAVGGVDGNENVNASAEEEPNDLYTSPTNLIASNLPT